MKALISFMVSPSVHNASANLFFFLHDSLLHQKGDKLHKNNSFKHLKYLKMLPNAKSHERD